MSNPLQGKTTISTGGGGIKGTDAPKAGNRLGICVAVIDLGTHEGGMYQGKQLDPMRTVFVAWELCKDIKSGSNMPHVIGQRFTLSFNKKSNLVKTLECWRGREYPGDVQVDLTQLLGKACYVNVMHADAKEGNVYVNVKGVSPLPEEVKAPVPKHKPFFYFIGSPDAIPEHDWLPYVYGSSVKDLITSSSEYLKILESKLAAKEAAAPSTNGDAYDGAGEEPTPFEKAGAQSNDEPPF